MSESTALGIDDYPALLADVFDQQIVQWTAEPNLANGFRAS